MKNVREQVSQAASRGIFFNTGNGPSLQPIDIGHEDYIGLVDPEIAFWSLIRKDRLSDALAPDGPFMKQVQGQRAEFREEMRRLRFGLKPTAVYFNPTDRCNLNCTYCYIPEDMRREGVTMSPARLLEALGILREFFKPVLPEGVKPQIVFHGAEPMLAREAIFAGMEQYRDDFRFGVQTNGSLLDAEAIEFLTSRGIGIGLSLDSSVAEVADRTRQTWGGSSVYAKVCEVLEQLRGYPNYNVICTVTQQNMESLVNVVDFYHEHQVPVCMLNPVRCTRQGARDIKPKDEQLVPYYLAALDRTEELFRKTGRRLVVANFANVLVGIVAPTARRLMCDISPCGGGRCFFAVSASGDLFPCSEFVGVEQFKGGNLFEGKIEDALDTPAFQMVTGRKVEDIEPCARCAVRHFCGSPCPAEAHEMNGGMDQPGAFCELYEEQARYALRLIADGRESAFLWDGWDKETSTDLNITAISDPAC
ncbi:MAG: peptide-modifying radical SAM enzyme CbpB [Deltaproteobacteria bacterium]|nr:peptide-modifying radical SAM enzyme CbpB [Deltaproteobacteria bacterium]